MTIADLNSLTINFRSSLPGDTPEIHSIYAYYVLNGLGTFEEVPPTVEEMEYRRHEVERQNMPFWVAEVAGAVVGFGYAGPYHARTAYRFTSQASVYVRHDLHNRGIGRGLIRELVTECTAAGFRQMLALVGDSANTSAIRLFTRSGFQYRGQQVGVGYKFGNWIDVVVMQRALGDGTRTSAGAGAAKRVPIA